MVNSKTSKASAEAQSAASDSTRENSFYDTPGTSIPTTPPPDGSSRTYSGKGKGKAPVRPLRPQPGSSKRKAIYIPDSEDEDDEDFKDAREQADLKLAIALQEQEYSDGNKRRKLDDDSSTADQPPSKGKNRRPDPFDESGDSLSEVSDLESVFNLVSDEKSAEESQQDAPEQPTRRPGRTRRGGPAGASTLGKRERKLLKHHPELKTMWSDLEAIPPIKYTPASQPQFISLQLKSYQLEGLDWMIKQEQTQWQGGLLGDEMGMGKTIQAVALIMSDYPQKDPTLVLAPPVALMQWSREIEDYTNGKLKVFVYHGSNPKVKKMTVKELRAYDVILISYNSLESLHRKETKGWGRGENIVKERSVVHAIEYHRCILDEAHSIKSRQTGSAKACFALNSKYKWCLSGTPVQNRIGEFFSLLRFLQVRPFAEYQCNNCTCASINWNMDGRHICIDCGHSASSHISIFNQELLKLIQSASRFERQDGLHRLHLITGRIMLRREKKNHVDSMVSTIELALPYLPSPLTRCRNFLPKRLLSITNSSERLSEISLRVS
jgi:DNA repair protein RAD16